MKHYFIFLERDGKGPSVDMGYTREQVIEYLKAETEKAKRELAAEFKDQVGRGRLVLDRVSIFDAIMVRAEVEVIDLLKDHPKVKAVIESDTPMQILR